MKLSENNQNALIIGGFFLISIVCVAPMIFFGKTLVLRDTFFEFRFLYDFSKENLSNGTMPLWNPYSSCGQPFIANPQTAFFYPFSWLYYLLDFNQAYTVFIFIHLLLAGVFMYAFMKPIIRSHWASFWGGLIYMLNGLIVTRIEFLSEFASIAWIPAILALLRLNILSPSWLASVLLGAAISIQFLAGHTQTFYHTALLGFFFTTFLFFSQFSVEKKASAVWRPMKFLIVAGVLALLIVMIQLAPTFELFTQSLRSQSGYDARTGLASLNPVHALTLLYPYLFGWPGYLNYWGSTYEFWASSFYAGVMPFVFFLLALLIFPALRKGRFSIPPIERYYFIFFLSSFGAFFVMALGDYSPIFRLAYDYIPGFDKFRWPSSSLLICIISISVLAPLGLMWFLQFAQHRSQSAKIWITVTLCALITASLALAIAMNLSPSSAASIVEAVKPTLTESLQNSRASLMDIVGSPVLYDRDAMAKLGITVLFNTSFIIIVCILLWGRLSGRIQEKYFVVGVILFTAMDLIGNANMAVSFLDKNMNLKEPRIVGTIPENDRHHRVMARTDDFQQYAYGTKDRNTLLLGIEALTGEVGLAQRLFRTDGKGVLKIRNYSDFSGFQNLPFAFQSKILKFLDVKYLLQLKSSSIKESASLELDPSSVAEYQKEAALNSEPWTVQMATIAEPLPRIFVVPRYAVMKSDTIEQKQLIFQSLLDESFDFSKTVIVDEPVEGLKNADDVHFKIRKAPSYANPNQVKAVIETDKDGILVISDVFYPGWELFVNGSKQKIYKANTTFRAGVLKAGVNDILFDYNPKSFKIGYLFSILGIVLSIVLLMIHFRVIKFRD